MEEGTIEEVIEWKAEFMHLIILNCHQKQVHHRMMMSGGLQQRRDAVRGEVALLLICLEVLLCPKKPHTPHLAPSTLAPLHPIKFPR